MLTLQEHGKIRSSQPSRKIATLLNTTLSNCCSVTHESSDSCPSGCHHKVTISKTFSFTKGAYTVP